MKYETSNKNRFWSMKNSGKMLSELQYKVNVTSLSTYDFSTLYTTMPHNLIKEKLDFLERTFKTAFKNYGSLYLACNDSKAFSLCLTKDNIHFGHAYFSSKLFSNDSICSSDDFICESICRKLTTKIRKFRPKLSLTGCNTLK